MTADSDHATTGPRLARRRARMVRRRLRKTGVALAAVLVLASIPLHSPPASATTPILGPQALTAEDLASFYRSVRGEDHRLPAEVTLDQLARYFIEEGRAEGVRGDIAFAQSILETGWFTFPDHGQVRPHHFNYAGLGAVDGGDDPNQFRSPRIGVRAQIQHLRAYGDATVTESSLANPLESLRWHLVDPKGRAPNWEDLGGIADDGKAQWATDPEYSEKIMRIWGNMLQHAGKRLDGAVPITGDWNGDGHTTPGWYDQGRVHLSNSLTSPTADIVYSYGRSGDVPIVGDFNGDGRDSVSVLRGRRWYIKFGRSGGSADRDFTYGRLHTGDYALAGDWNGDGRVTPGIVRDGEWHLRNALRGGSADVVFTYGRVRQGDVPIVGDWTGDGRDTPGIVRGSEWHLRNVNRGGHADTVFNYGRSSDIAVVGNWNGRGGDTAGVVRGGTWHLRNALRGGGADVTTVFFGG